MWQGDRRPGRPSPWNSTKEKHYVERLLYFLIMIVWLEWLKMYIFFNRQSVLCAASPSCTYFLYVFSHSPHVNHRPWVIIPSGPMYLESNK